MTTVAIAPDTVTAAIRRIVEGRDLDETEGFDVASVIMSGRAAPDRIAGLLVAMRMKGETVEEILGFVRAMRERVESPAIADDSLVDTCGTGGDGKGTFNISTVSALVAAGAGCRVAKHGNRSVSGLCGSSQLLEELGVPHDPGPEEAARCLDETGVCFLFAPRYHQAARHAAGPRRAIGVRSIFNIVGPLTNPAGARRQLLGVFAPHLTEPLAEVLRRLGSTHCLVVHGQDGLDEITLSGKTRISELRDGSIHTFDLEPQSLGFSTRSLDEVRGGDPATNARIALEVLDGRPGAPREITRLNSAAVIYAAGEADSLEEGVELATRSIDEGRAQAVLQALRSQGSGDA